MSDEPVLTIEETATVLGATKHDVLQLIAKRELKAKLRVSAKEVDQYIRGLSAGTGSNFWHSAKRMRRFTS